MAKKEVLLSIDMGGTNIKSAILSLDKKILSHIFSFPAYSGETTIDNFKNSIEQLFLAIASFNKKHDYYFTKVGISSPGPFNYKTGESLMDHKFAFLKNKVVGEYIKEVTGLKDLTFKYVHDVNSFLYGAIDYYGWKTDKTIAITVGTGLGCAIYDGKGIINNEMDEPVDARYYKAYKGIMFEDFVSGRGVLTKAKSLGLNVNSSLDVYNLAKEDNKLAKETFVFLGHMIKEAVIDRINELDIHRFLIGGAVSGSHEFFTPTLKKELNREMEIVIPEDQEILTLIGALSGF